ncbi:MAG: Fur family transcriptional regulator [Pseudomonadota bacterium]
MHDDSPPSTDALQKELREKGVRMSPARAAILKALTEASDHPDAYELRTRARAILPSVSSAAVYRFTRALEDVGVLVRREFGDGRGRFELVCGHEHIHLTDMNTEQVVEIETDELEPLLDEVAHRLGFKLLNYRVQLFGIREEAHPQEPRDPTRPRALEKQSL